MSRFTKHDHATFGRNLGDIKYSISEMMFEVERAYGTASPVLYGLAEAFQWLNKTSGAMRCYAMADVGSEFTKKAYSDYREDVEDALEESDNLECEVEQ